MEFAGWKKADSKSQSGKLQRGDAQLQAMEILFADFVCCWLLSSGKTWQRISVRISAESTRHNCMQWMVV